MRYKKFTIKNFKGIKHTEIDLSSLTGANVFPIVGLNESGKTTILEAIHSFAPDYKSGTVVKLTKGSDQERAVSRVPRHLLASFTGDIVVEATATITDEDRENVATYLRDEYELRISEASIPDIISMARKHVFKRGDYIKTSYELSFAPLLKSKGQRSFRAATDNEISRVWEALREIAPDVAYYPTFIFDFPERIYVTPRAGDTDYFYRSVLEDILAVDGQEYTLKDLERRIRSEDYELPWADFSSIWTRSDDRRKVQQIIDRASSAVTRNVFGKWNRIFGEDTKGKELAIDFDVEEGRKLSPDKKSYISCDNHDMYVWFEIKDGTRRFKVNDRSLGFRWFFAFLLFTHFRVSRKSSRDVLFLFDEPASNLHAAAQQKLIESFPDIAGESNMMIYTTHSHYMIDPAWLEQTFIVTNRSESPDRSIVDSAILDDESLDIQATRYRKFVNDHPSDTSYFQPIVDRLEVVPSKFDHNLPSVVVEGKSDYYILEYARKLTHLGPDRFIPATGSGTFGALIALSVGWGVKFLFLLDADHAGLSERERYAADCGTPFDSLTTIDDYIEGGEAIESLIDDEAAGIIKKSIPLDKSPTKKQILQFFQENLARGNIISLGSGFDRNARKLLAGLKERLDKL